MVSTEDREFKVVGAQSFGLAIKEFRTIAGVTQLELSRRSGLHRSYIAELENGSTTNAMRYLLEACRSLDLEIIIRPNRQEL
jgi:transcriptional regulator with XRE-family HTH domain